MSDTSKTSTADASGLAALSICESLLIALAEKGLLEKDEVYFVLEDAADAHRSALQENPAVELHQAAARLVELVMAQSNSVRGASQVGMPEATAGNDVDRTNGSD